MDERPSRKPARPQTPLSMGSMPPALHRPALLRGCVSFRSFGHTTRRLDADVTISHKLLDTASPAPRGDTPHLSRDLRASSAKASEHRTVLLSLPNHTAAAPLRWLRRNLLNSPPNRIGLGKPHACPHGCPTHRDRLGTCFARCPPRPQKKGNPNVGRAWRAQRILLSTMPLPAAASRRPHTQVAHTPSSALQKINSAPAPSPAVKRSAPFGSSPDVEDTV